MIAELEQVRSEVLEAMDVSKEVSDPQLYALIGDKLAKQNRTRLLSLQEREDEMLQIFNSLRKLDVLQELLERDEITEIMVNGVNHIFYEQNGCLKEWKTHFSNLDKLQTIVQQIAALSNKIVNESEPILDTRLSDGSRVNIVLPPVSLEGPCITIRKFSGAPITLDRLQMLGAISSEVKAFLVLLVKAGYNIFISGGTGSGKTTFLNALSQYIPEEDRVVTIEDSAELQLRRVKNLVRLESRGANANGTGEITIRDLIKTSLRMRPTRVIVGEVRGSEALDLLQAYNTGHDGGMSTGHGNSCEDMLHRLETMVLMGMDLPIPAIRGQIASGIDIMVHLGRLRDKSRKVLDIVELTGIKEGEIQTQSLYQFVENSEKDGKICGYWKKNKELCHVDKLAAWGYLDCYKAMNAASQ